MPERHDTEVARMQSAWIQRQMEAELSKLEADKQARHDADRRKTERIGAITNAIISSTIGATLWPFFLAIASLGWSVLKALVDQYR